MDRVGARGSTALGVGAAAVDREPERVARGRRGAGPAAAVAGPRVPRGGRAAAAVVPRRRRSRARRCWRSPAGRCWRSGARWPDRPGPPAPHRRPPRPGSGRFRSPGRAPPVPAGPDAVLRRPLRRRPAGARGWSGQRRRRGTGQLRRTPRRARSRRGRARGGAHHLRAGGGLRAGRSAGLPWPAARDAHPRPCVRWRGVPAPRPAPRRGLPRPAEPVRRTGPPAPVRGRRRVRGQAGRAPSPTSLGSSVPTTSLWWQAGIADDRVRGIEVGESSVRARSGPRGFAPVPGGATAAGPAAGGGAPGGAAAGGAAGADRGAARRTGGGLWRRRPGGVAPGPPGRGTVLDAGRGRPARNELCGSPGAGRRAGARPRPAAPTARRGHCRGPVRTSGGDAGRGHRRARLRARRRRRRPDP